MPDLEQTVGLTLDEQYTKQQAAKADRIFEQSRQKIQAKPITPKVDASQITSFGAGLSAMLFTATTGVSGLEGAITGAASSMKSLGAVIVGVGVAAAAFFAGRELSKWALGIRQAESEAARFAKTTEELIQRNRELGNVLKGAFAPAETSIKNLKRQLQDLRPGAGGDANVIDVAARRAAEDARAEADARLKSAREQFAAQRENLPENDPAIATIAKQQEAAEAGIKDRLQEQLKLIEEIRKQKRANLDTATKIAEQERDNAEFEQKQADAARAKMDAEKAKFDAARNNLEQFNLQSEVLNKQLTLEKELLNTANKTTEQRAQQLKKLEEIALKEEEIAAQQRLLQSKARLGLGAGESLPDAELKRLQQISEIDRKIIQERFRGLRDALKPTEAAQVAPRFSSTQLVTPQLGAFFRDFAGREQGLDELKQISERTEKNTRATAANTAALLAKSRTQSTASPSPISVPSS